MILRTSDRLKQLPLPLRLLALAFIAVAIEWLALVRPYPLLQFVTWQRRSFARIADYNLGAGLRLAAAYLVLTLLYLLALRLLRRTTSDRWSLVLAIWLGWALQVLMLIWAHPGESLDVYEYIFRGHMVAELGVSPLTTPPNALP